MSCSSKDGVVYVKPPGMKNMEFMMYGECDDREFGTYSLWKNRHRAELEIIKSIRFKKRRQN
jgi:hypothetical protein